MRRSDDRLWFEDSRKLLAAVRASRESSELPEIPGYTGMLELSEGGQGTVYVARHEGSGRRVAVKVLHVRGRPGSAAEYRFEREVELASTLDHPHIVRLLDAGATNGGRPFLAMEYVEGCALDEYAGSEAELDGYGGSAIRRVLALFLRICDAVAYAHQRGVIHRDLKPGNIRIDCDGQPRILDFGLARLADADQHFARSVTATSLFLGTPAYAAPEQIEAAGDGIDTRADIYALGVILYELLTGRLPYADGSTIGGVIRGITSHEIVRPGQVADGMPRDLEAVMLKALAKDRSERYQTVNALADDLRAFLAGRPTLARAPTRGEELLQVIRRHPAVTSLVTVVVVLSIAFAATASLLAMRAESMRRDAVRAQEQLSIESTRSKAALEFLTDLIFSAHAVDHPGEAALAQSMLEIAEHQLAAVPDRDPAVQAALHDVVGRLYFSMSRADKAQQHFAAASVGGETSASPSATYFTRRVLLANALMLEGRFDEVEEVTRQMLVERSKNAEPVSGMAAVSVAKLGRSLKRQAGRLDLAEEVLREGLSSTRADREDHEKARVLLKVDLAEVLIAGDRSLDEAAALLDSAIADAMHLYGPDFHRTLRARMSRAIVLKKQSRLPEALAEATDVAERCLRVFGERDDQTLAMLRYLGEIQWEAGELEAARATLERCLAGCTALFGPSHPHTKKVRALRDQVVADHEP